MLNNTIINSSIYKDMIIFFNSIILKKFNYLICILLLSLISFAIEQTIYADHISNRKYTVYDTKLVTELQGIVAVIDGSNLLIIPDPNYRNLAIQGNKIIPPESDCYGHFP